MRGDLAMMALLMLAFGAAVDAGAPSTTFASAFDEWKASGARLDAVETALARCVEGSCGDLAMMAPLLMALLAFGAAADAGALRGGSCAVTSP